MEKENQATTRLWVFILGAFTGCGLLVWIIASDSFFDVFPFLKQSPERLQASVDLREVELGETLLYTVMLRGTSLTVERLFLSGFQSFDLVRTERRDTDLTEGTARFKHQVFYYSLIPRQIGDFTFGPAGCVVDGRMLKSNKVRVRVFPDHTKQ